MAAGAFLAGDSLLAGDSFLAGDALGAALEADPPVLLAGKLTGEDEGPLEEQEPSEGTCAGGAARGSAAGSLGFALFGFGALCISKKDSGSMACRVKIRTEA